MREVYRSSKAALNMFIRSFAARHAEARRPMVLMAPGWVRTELGGPDARLTIEDSVPKPRQRPARQAGPPRTGVSRLSRPHRPLAGLVAALPPGETMEEHDAMSEVERGRICSAFDDFLDEKGIREEVDAQVVKEVLAWQIEQEMRAVGLTNTAMARRMSTSLAQFDRLMELGEAVDDAKCEPLVSELSPLTSR